MKIMHLNQKLRTNKKVIEPVNCCNIPITHAVFIFQSLIIILFLTCAISTLNGTFYLVGALIQILITIGFTFEILRFIVFHIFLQTLGSVTAGYVFCSLFFRYNYDPSFSRDFPEITDVHIWIFAVLLIANSYYMKLIHDLYDFLEEKHERAQEIAEIEKCVV
ncbi:unnamed protein product [Caenorhabditis angaria]|uniref:Uncharacterized protein n=1 Tax=Caenorhabditis angaria TaxID=860376 RepID=A0A9P1IHA2_9PELO|nr:unnamed protein product [Caenorhabditis angaria]